MKKTLYTLSLVLVAFSLIVFFACNKSSADSSTGADNNNIPAEQTVTANLQGRVLDENGVPVQGAAVSSGAATTTTDINGVFTFSKISMSSRFGFVKVVKQGYFTGSRSIITNGGASNYVSIQLIPRVSKGSFPAATGGTIPVQSGDTAAFPASAVINAVTNATYTGNVNVYATYLDPTASDLYKYMPGDLRGIGTDGKETALQSFGMLAVEMEGDAGEKLQMAAGKKATLTWAIPASLQAAAPATIPLWYFNDSTGRWIEEGTATRIGNSYVGQVGHFSYWNCDARSGTVNFKVHLKDQHGNPLAYTYIQFKSDAYGTRGGYTDSSGFAQGLIPKGQSLVMQVVTECGNVLGGINVGPALADQDLGTVTVTLTIADLTITGKVVNCAGNPVDSGFVMALIDGLNYSALVSKGGFTLPVMRCFSNSTQIRLTAYDFVALQKGSPVMMTASAGNLDAGILSACGVDINQYVSFTFQGVNYDFTNPADSVLYLTVGSSVTFAAYRPINGGTAKNGVINISISNLTGPGVYAINLGFQAPNVSGGSGTGSCTITGYGSVGTFITGTFNGNIRDSLNTYPISGQLRVKRTQ